MVATMNLAKVLNAALAEMKEADDARDVHALRRARERYGLFLNTRDLKAISQRLASGEGLRLKTLPGNAASYLIKVSGKVCHVVYDPANRRTVTFLDLRQRRKRNGGNHG